MRIPDCESHEHDNFFFFTNEMLMKASGATIKKLILIPSEKNLLDLENKIMLL